MSQKLDEQIRSWMIDLFDELDLELYDVEHAGGVLRVVIDQKGDPASDNGPSGVGLDEIAAVTRRLSQMLDEHDPIQSGYTLEVSSPGLERKLRTPEHWRGAADAKVNIKLRKGVSEVRRLTGTVVNSDDEAVTLTNDDGTQRCVDFEDIESARTVFEWQASPKPGSPASRKAKRPQTSPTKKQSAKEKKAES